MNTGLILWVIAITLLLIWAIKKDQKKEKQISFNEKNSNKN